MKYKSKHIALLIATFISFFIYQRYSVKTLDFFLDRYYVIFLVSFQFLFLLISKNKIRVELNSSNLFSNTIFTFLKFIFIGIFFSFTISSTLIYLPLLLINDKLSSSKESEIITCRIVSIVDGRSRDGIFYNYNNKVKLLNATGEEIFKYSKRKDFKNCFLFLNCKKGMFNSKTIQDFEISCSDQI